MYPALPSVADVWDAFEGCLEQLLKNQPVFKCEVEADTNHSNSRDISLELAEC